jgi:hypothetical protein
MQYPAFQFREPRRKLCHPSQPKEASIIYRIIFLVKINPTKVVRAAIQNAASVASLLITTEAMIAEVPRRAARLLRRCRAAAWAAWISKSGHSRPI